MVLARAEIAEIGDETSQHLRRVDLHHIAQIEELVWKLQGHDPPGLPFLLFLRFFLFTKRKTAQHAEITQARDVETHRI